MGDWPAPISLFLGRGGEGAKRNIYNAAIFIAFPSIAYLESKNTIRLRPAVLKKEVAVRHCPPALLCLLSVTGALIALPPLATAASTLSSASYQLHGGTLAAAAGASSNASGTVSSSGVHLGGSNAV